MATPTFLRRPVRQIAFYVPDARKAATDHAAAFGSGPFFVMEHIPLTLARYRGQPGALDHTSAYGQWGDVMIEMVQVHGSEPSVFTDLYPGGGPGFHHIALIVDNLIEAMADFTAKGFAEAFYAELGPGAAFAMMDATQQFGHFVELYEPSPPLLGVYHLVANAALNFDGSNPVRDFSLF
jgi:catechol 2,3-dioxygenase-like lactoylglutathione lyase family enzyme